MHSLNPLTEGVSASIGSGLPARAACMPCQIEASTHMAIALAFHQVFDPVVLIVAMFQQQPATRAQRPRQAASACRQASGVCGGFVMGGPLSERRIHSRR